ncbi:MAG: fluoride efflux transporter CrcB [Planctomycetes bacterium]|nr:fluoride efflux transporter CrcB [Planctomycetota bacterium]
MAQFLWVCLGGAIGSGARFLVHSWLQPPGGEGFPAGTLAVNVVGSFLIAFVITICAGGDRLPTSAQTVLTAGVLGGFTTYSAFSWETLKCLQRGATTMAAVYVVATLLGCLGACACGCFVGKWIAA